MKNKKGYNKVYSKLKTKVKKETTDTNLSEENIILIETDETDLKRIANDVDVEYIEEDILLFASSDSLALPDSERLPDDVKQWYLEAVNVPLDVTGIEPVKVGILDSGINYTDDIDVTERVCFVPGEEDVSILWEDGSGHGTGIAGVIAAKHNEYGIDGINPNAELYSIRVLKSDNTGNLSSVISGIYWAIENNIDILNISLGTTVNSSILYEAVKAATESGMLLIAAGGNEYNQAVQFPAAYPQVLAVGGTDSRGELLSYTSLGTELDILAPGDQVITTGLLYGISSVGGTSIATAQVTGAASLLWGMDKTKSVDFISQLIVNSARKVEDAVDYNVGLLDISYAVECFPNFSENYIEKEIVEYVFPENMEPVEVFDTQGIVNGLWGGESHVSIITGYAAHQNNLSPEAYAMLNPNRISIMVATAKAADLEGIFKKDVNALHGTGNYIQSLKYLFQCAQNVRAGQNIKDASNNAYNQFAFPTTLLPKLKDATEKMLENNDHTEGITSNPEDPAVRYFKVLGFAMHCMGDTFAHRSFVMNISDFSSADFKNTSGHQCIDSIITKMIKDTEGTSYCREWKCFQKAFATGKMEFRDVSRFTNMKEDVSKKKYEDNQLVQPARFSDTKVQSLKYLEASLTRKGFSSDGLVNPTRGSILERALEFSNEQ